MLNQGDFELTKICPFGWLFGACSNAPKGIPILVGSLS
jgi:hypothetical protein